MHVIIIPGRCPVKKNTKRVYRNGHVQYSQKYAQWEAQALLAMRSQWRGKKTLNAPLEIWFQFDFQNRHAEADVSNLIEGPQDALSKAGVIEDDGLIRFLHATKSFGKDPKTIICIREVGSWVDQVLF